MRLLRRARDRITVLIWVPVPDCALRNELIIEWHNSITKLSESVDKMRLAINDAAFQRSYQATERARQQAENARLSIERHRKEHGC